MKEETKKLLKENAISWTVEGEQIRLHFPGDFFEYFKMNEDEKIHESVNEYLNFLGLN